MKTKFFALLALGLVAALPIPESTAAPQVGNQCQNYGCKLTISIAHKYFNANNSWSTGCTEFQAITGRRVRNNFGFQGGVPVSLGGTQVVKWNFGDCAQCASPVIPAFQDSIAIDGGGIGAGGFYFGSFGRYGCDAGNLGPGGPGGGGGVN